MPQSEVSEKDKDEEVLSFQGILLPDLLKKAGLEFGKGLRGKNQSQYLLVGAADGYKIIFSLPEIDPEFSGKQILWQQQRIWRKKASLEKKRFLLGGFLTSLRITTIIIEGIRWFIYE